MVLVTSSQNMDGAFKKSELTPNIVPEGFIGETLLGIKYPSGEDVALGNFIKPSDSDKTPEVSFVAPDQDSKYTLLLVDPDAPSKQDPSMAPYRHWVLTDIPAPGDSSVNLAQASEYSSYMGPAPPKKTGDHRYIFLLYKQPNESNFKAKSLKSKELNNFDWKPWVAENNLELIAVNFFISRNDIQ